MSPSLFFFFFLFFVFPHHFSHSIQGSLCIGVVQLKTLPEFKDRKIKVLHSVVSPDFGQLWAVVGVYAPNTEASALLSGTNAPVPTEVYLVSFRTERLAANLGDVKDLAATSETILQTLRSLEEVFGTVQNEWKAAYSSFGTFFEKYSRKLNLLGGSPFLSPLFLKRSYFRILFRFQSRGLDER